MFLEGETGTKPIAMRMFPKKEGWTTDQGRLQREAAGRSLSQNESRVGLFRDSVFQFPNEPACYYTVVFIPRTIVRECNMLASVIISPCAV